MQLDINIEGLVVEAVSAALHPDAIRDVLQNAVKKAVTGAIEEQFRYNSPFKKLLEEQMAGAMPTKIDGIAAYATLVKNVVAETLEAQQNQALEQTVKAQLETILKPLPASMKLGEFMKELFKAYKHDEHDEHGDVSMPEVEIDSHELTVGYWRLYFDKEDSYGSKYSSRVQMDFQPGGKCYSAKIDSREPGHIKRMGVGHAVDALITNIYACAVLIEYEDVDPEDIWAEMDSNCY